MLIRQIDVGGDATLHGGPHSAARGLGAAGHGAARALAAGGGAVAHHDAVPAAAAGAPSLRFVLTMNLVTFRRLCSP
jgi:hypothetical protein